MCANISKDVVDFNEKIVDVVLIPRLCNEFIMDLSGIIGYTFDSVIFFDGLISFLMVISLSLITILLWIFINSSVVF